MRFGDAIFTNLPFSFVGCGKLSHPPLPQSSLANYIDMAKKATIHRCPTCKVIFPTINALNDHYKETSHIPQCEPQVYKQVGIQSPVLIDISISWAQRISNRNILYRRLQSQRLIHHIRHFFTNVNLATRYFSLRYPAYYMYVSNCRS